MKIKFNWGHGILVFLILFIGSLVWRVYLANQREINLVYKDYYPQGLNYQERINETKNFNKLGIDFKVEKASKGLTINFSPFKNFKKLNGVVTFYRPSSYRFDKNFEIETDSNGLMNIPDTGFIQGRYTIWFDFNDSSVKYFHKKQYIF